MKELRKLIRALIVEKGELRKRWSPGIAAGRDGEAALRGAGQIKGVDLKKWFRENADQESLQKLMYIHWGTPDEIETILNSHWKGGGKNELNTSIHDPSKRLVPWVQDEMWDGDSHTVGLIVKGWVTFASNVDIDSGRLGQYLDMVSKAEPDEGEVRRRFTSTGRGMDDFWPIDSKEFRKRASQQHKSSGVPKRPDVNSLERRFRLRKIIDDIDDGKTISEDDEEFLDAELLDDLGLELDEFIEQRKDPEYEAQEGEAMSLASARQIKNLEDAFILSFEDFDHRDEWEMEDEFSKGTLNWPEALVDNWKPIAIVGDHLEQFGELLMQANDYEMPLVDLDLDLHEDWYDEAFQMQCDDYEYDDFEDAGEDWKEACEEEDYSKVWSHIKSPKI